MLFKRSWKQVTRDKAALRLRVATNIQSAVVFGGIWWRLRRLQASVLSRLGLLQACPPPRFPASACIHTQETVHNEPTVLPCEAVSYTPIHRKRGCVCVNGMRSC